VRPYEPDFTGPKAPRNPWDPEKHPDHYSHIQEIIERADKEIVRPPKYSKEVKLEVYRLRDQGYTLRQIAETVGVSKSTACLYIQKNNRKLAEQRNTTRVRVKQPGTNKVVETEYSVNEVNVGNIIPKLPKKTGV
jgi:transposase-like protein